MDKGGHYDVEKKGWMEKFAFMMRILKGRTDKEGHFYVEMKGWMKSGAL